MKEELVIGGSILLFLLLLLSCTLFIYFSRSKSADPPISNESNYRILVSAQCNFYQDWQILSLFHSAKKYWPGISVTRLMSCAPPLRSEYKYKEICPTVTLSEWGSYMEDDYVPYNRPGTLIEFLQKYNFPEEIIIIMDPDMIILKPLNFSIHRGSPIAQRYEYMGGYWLTELSKMTKNPHLVQPVGVPILIHRDDLRRVAPLYLQFIRRIRAHPIYRDKIGWIAEMYGYALAAAELGITHTMREDLMSRTPYKGREGESYTLHYDISHEDSCNEFKWDKRKYWKDLLSTSELFPIPCESAPTNFRRLFEELNESLTKYRIESSIHPRSMDCFFIINCLNPPSTPLSYTSVRSVYSIEERWTQLVTSINSVRKYHPSAAIYICETGDISPVYRRRQTEISGVIWLNYGHDPEISQQRNSPHKGLTEIRVLHRAYEEWRKYRRLFKLSGRYQVTKPPPAEFQKFSFAPWYDGHPRHCSTVYYGVPQGKFLKFKKILDNYLTHYQNESIETSFTRDILDSEITWYRHNSLGFQGNISVDGTYVSG